MPAMTGKVLLLTGKLAEKSLRRVMSEAALPGLDYEIRNVGVSVAALMTTDLVQRRLPDAGGAGRVIVPGLCAGDLDALSAHFGVPVLRGPAHLKDLSAFLGGKVREVDLSRHDITIFAEITDAPRVSVDAVLARAEAYRRDGADVIDVGCLPGEPFPHLEETVRALCEAGFRVSVDSITPEELLRGGKAGAHYLLSLKESTAWIADEVDSVPVLIPEQAGDIASLDRAIGQLRARGKRFIADSILDPVHFGFTASLCRYAALRERHPDVEIMMGTGNITELTEADTAGMNALLTGIMSELGIQHLLTTEVSLHARSVVRELDAARRVMYAARDDEALPKGYSAALTPLHERKPFPYTLAEVRELAAEIRDRNYRVQVSAEGVHAYNRDGLLSGTDPFEFWPGLAELHADPSHAFYMGVELARAQIAHRLGKRFVQDEALEWGAGAPPDSGAEPGLEARFHAFKPEGTTLQSRRDRRAARGRGRRAASEPAASAETLERADNPEDRDALMIRETVVTTCNAEGEPHLAPLGVREQDGLLVLAPFHPSATLDNLRACGQAVVNLTDDVRVIAGCLTGRRQWPCEAALRVRPPRLAGTLAHRELEVERIEEDAQRPRFHCRVVHEQGHRPFRGFNRAQAAVIEAAILVSRLHMLPAEKIRREVDYLRIAIDKTAGPAEREAWGWLMERIQAHMDAAG